MSLTFQQSKGCSQCCEGTLRLKDSGNEAEKSESEVFAYYECDRCGFRVKEFETGRTEIPDGDEWDRFCE